MGKLAVYVLFMDKHENALDAKQKYGARVPEIAGVV